MSSDRLFVVTTRSQLRSLRFFPAMAFASWRIRGQLARTEGVVRWASVIAGPREFWTITVWRSRHLMQEFMRSQEHGQIMWQFSRWLNSFWLMRWRPGPREFGAWQGLETARTSQEPAPMDEDQVAFADRVLEHMPLLRTAVGVEGAASYYNAPHVRQRRAQVQGSGGMVVRLQVRPWKTPMALDELRWAGRHLRCDHDALGVAVGLGRAGEVYLLGVWSDRDGALRVLGGSWLQSARERWGQALWASEWLPENEFGHWDGRRLRIERRRRVVTSAARST